MIRRPLLRSVAVVLASMCLISGCHHWTPEPLSTASLNAQHPSVIRVELVNGRTVTIHQPRFVGDSILGFTDSLVPGPASLTRTTISAPITVALAQVRTVEARHLDGLATAGMTLLVVVGVFFAMAGLYAATCSPSDFYCGR